MRLSLKSEQAAGGENAGGSCCGGGCCCTGETGAKTGAKRWAKRLGVGAFAFFLIKGLVWLAVGGVAIAAAV